MNFTLIKEVSAISPVLITGHNGFKGSWLVQILDVLGINNVGLSLDVEEDSLYARCKLIGTRHEYLCDINNFKHVKDIVSHVKPSVVMHLAAQPIVSIANSDPYSTIQTNVLGTLNLLESVRQVGGVRAVGLVTTDKVYKNLNLKQKKFKESDELGGTEPYGASKAAAEMLAQGYRQILFDSVQTNLISLRSGNVIGGGDWGEDRLIPDIIKSCKNNKFMLVRYPNAIRPWQHVLEAIFCYLDIAKYMYLNKMNKVITWNVGVNEHHWTVIKIIKLFQSQFLNFSYKIAKDKKFLETKILQLSNKKFSQMFKWRPILNMSQTINFTIEWYKILVDSKIPNLKQITNSQIKFFLDARSKRY